MSLKRFFLDSQPDIFPSNCRAVSYEQGERSHQHNFTGKEVPEKVKTVNACRLLPDDN